MELKQIIKLVNKHFNCDIRQNKRDRELVMARAVYFWLAKNVCKISMKKIGAAVGRDHASVLYGLANLDNWIRFDDFFRIDFETIKMIVLKLEKQIANFKSQCLILGAVDKDKVILLNPSIKVPNGSTVQ